jgi:hypothetical protein
MPVLPDYLCADCGTDTTPCTRRRGCRHRGKWEWYMVQDAVWRHACMNDGFLCIGCLEVRLGRVLAPSDFTSAPVNEYHPWHSLRLLSRQGHVPAGKV